MLNRKSMIHGETEERNFTENKYSLGDNFSILRKWMAKNKSYVNISMSID